MTNTSQSRTKTTSVLLHTSLQSGGTFQAQSGQHRRVECQESLVQEVPTRWNSTLEMIKRVRYNRDPLHATLTQQKHNMILPTNAEYEKLAKLEKLLEPCRYMQVQH
ncbi:zinc finger BED domain-containing protein 1-like [Solea senegalensis]|uniref:Zinc finger BED domain-containing protein 1-like n=1 Tax=Solea senegalensis TaxID=28829 RepID=A0AAV6RD07_SOLSE|nr:zinc finger BED domain-containing protein 1-like [Solea senegalensis]